MSDNERYIVSARKYRPATFGSVVGQEALTRTLRNAVDSGRLAQAYLFCGPRGVGKTSCARIFAKRINCEHPTADGEACGECESCRAIEAGTSFNIIELDAASNNSVNDIREITEQVNIPPQQGKYRVFIIDEVHMLSSAAFNAFLKTLEEPPSYVVFILATTEKHKVIPTILSRCQIYDFKRITIDDMSRHLQYVASQEGIEAEPAALSVIAQKADGAMRDALSIFDQVSASCGGHVTYEKTIESLNVLDYGYYFRLTEAFRAGDVQQALLIYKEIRDAGFDSLFFINGLASHVRDLMVASDPSTAGLLEVGEDIGKRYVELAQSMPLQWYYGAMRLLNDADLNYRTSNNKQLLVELCLIRLCGGGNQLPTAQGHPASSATQPTGSPAGGQPAAQPRAQAPAQAQAAAQPRAQAPTAAPGAPRPAAPRPAMHHPAGQRPLAPRQPAGARPAQSGGMPRTFRLNGGAPGSSETPGGADGSQPPAATSRAETYSAQDFQKAWLEYIELHPELRLLTTAMRSGLPQKLGEEEYAIGVGSMAQASTFEHDLPPLVAHMRDRLRNDHIRIGIVEVARAPRARKLMPAEQLKVMVSENPMLGRLLSEMDAELV